MIVSGEPGGEQELLAKRPGQKLFDKMIDGDLRMPGAIAFARRRSQSAPAAAGAQLKVDHATRGLPSSPQHGGHGEELPGAAPSAAMRWPPRNVKFDAGMAEVRARDLHGLMFTPECKALRHAFFGRARHQQDPRRAG